MKTRTNKADRTATLAVSAYFEAFVGIRGFLPRVATSMMPCGIAGWPVRNVDGGGNVAFFTTYEAAEKAIRSCERASRVAS